MALSPLRLWPLLLACWTLPAGECCCPEGWGLGGRSIEGGDTVAWCVHPRSSARASEGRAVSALRRRVTMTRAVGKATGSALGHSFLLPFSVMNVICRKGENTRTWKLRVQIRMEGENSMSNF